MKVSLSSRPFSDGLESRGDKENKVDKTRMIEHFMTESPSELPVSQQLSMPEQKDDG
jgi:hypothetical protein